MYMRACMCVCVCMYLAWHACAVCLPVAAVAASASAAVAAAAAACASNPIPTLTRTTALTCPGSRLVAAGRQFECNSYRTLVLPLPLPRSLPCSFAPAQLEHGLQEARSCRRICCARIQTGKRKSKNPFCRLCVFAISVAQIEYATRTKDPALACPTLHRCCMPQQSRHPRRQSNGKSF